MFKYIIFETTDFLTKVIIFDCITDHSTIKNRFESMQWKVISAGKISKGFNCVNGSVSLGIKFDLKQSQEDTETINKMADYH